MFEITPQDIGQLDDKQLRTLVGLLCEAELRSRNYSTAAVTWGGDQNAKDGGLDVRVSLPGDAAIEGFIPRRLTGFQVKKQDMPPSAIAGEMCPNGNLRPVIRELAAGDGAYIIVSSEGSTSDSALTNRRTAMEDAANGLAGQIALDFYDRTRMATWVRSHAGLVVWVRREIGRAIPGWEPFGAWAYPAGGIEAEYLLENGVRIRARPAKTDADLSAEVGLKAIREILRNPGAVVRLVGLSGVGKTRFVQALFDSRIGHQALDQVLAVYTNMNNDPDPQPFNLASDLVANSTRAILIVDNCAADLHARLAQFVKTGTSSVGVLTVEYDIRDDQPEGTDVFEIQVASTQLIERLLEKRFPNVSQVDRRTAAEFSGGNGRIAIALADTVGRGGTLASLNHIQLFERLFEQRRGQDRSLLEMAQACALVYSFNGEDLSEGDEGELARIAALIGKTADQTYGDVAELLRRDLAQRRGKWRAILPHAVANRLAATALQSIPFSSIQTCLINGAPERLITSFSRRLAPEIIAAGRKLLEKMDFSRKNGANREDYHLQQVVEVCLAGDDGAGAAKSICKNLKNAVAEHTTYGFDHSQLVRALFRKQPMATLNALLTGDEEAILGGRQVIEESSHLRPNAMDEVSEACLFDWCGENPVVRFPLTASLVSAFTVSGDNNPVSWTPIAARLVHSAPDPIVVMRELVARFRPLVWSGSRSTIMNENARLIEKFDTQGNAALTAFIATQKQSLLDEARTDLEWETRIDRDRDERFE